MNLTREFLGRVARFDEQVEVCIPADEFKMGDVLILFNNTDEFMTLRSEIKQSYRSASRSKRSLFEWPPRSLLNVLFVADDIVVVTVNL